MYLKRIEVQGFKSFANKITFEFHNGITGIVGPNGSGKSNVADAVRWVLGEQRIKQLRGASMQDVIFSGTENRKPQGLASVSITLDNSDHQLPVDFEEVTVTRRIYRSGESEYRINGTSCRLKDINELFYDTGIGKEGYSIIGQGQIDKILSGRPEERRELFDEAAGIVKFKRRKQIAQKKLEDEQQNLYRVTDILSELEKQTGPLSKQSETAKKYLILKEELKKADASLFLMEKAKISLETGEIDKKISITAGDTAETNEKAERLKEEYDKIADEIRKTDEEVEKFQKEGNETSLQIESLNGQIEVLREQIHADEIYRDHRTNRILEIESDQKNRQNLLREEEEKRNALSESARTREAELKQAEDEFQKSTESVTSLEQELENKKSTVISALNDRSALSVNKQRYDSMLEQVQIRRSEIANRLLQVKTDEELWNSRIREEEEKMSSCMEKIQKLRTDSEAAEAVITTCQSEITRLNKNLNHTQTDYHTSYTRLESLRNMAERYEGYGNSIRKVMDVRDRVRGIHGVVADLIVVPKEYETAIETALGGSIQNIVTESEETAKVLIEYLKKNKFGRATFLPLTAITSRGSFDHPQALKEPGAIGLASQLVSAEKTYDGLVNYLLGRVLVVDHIDHAIAIARKYRHSIRIVTPEGDLINPGGSMSGGAYKNSSNLLGRKREMDDMEEMCRKYLHQADRIEKELSGQEKLLAEKLDVLKIYKQDLQKSYLEQNTIKMQIDRFHDRNHELVSSVSDLSLENRQLEEQQKDLRQQIEIIAEGIREKQDTHDEASDFISRFQTVLEQKKTELETKRSALSDVRMKNASITQEISYFRQNEARMKDEIRHLEEEKQELISNGDREADAIREKQEKIALLNESIGKYQEGKQDILLREEGCKVRKRELEEKQKHFFDRREELTRRLNDLSRDEVRLSSQKEKLEEKLETLVNYMWNEYELTFSTAEEFCCKDWDSDVQLKEKISEIRQEIKELGSVNVNAIEEYREVSERYEFLKTQHEDLVKAREALISIVEELDTGMRNQFREKFAEIQAEFNRVFRELFGGGNGTLELVEEEDILEAGIQIIAQPPGKKLQNMMQMSGGEKSLTAIALLFAIQNLKPSPFCLLDEIEAALDDYNVDRFAKYLHKLTKNTQFIVITHRRGTMEASDRLYGITMQEKGVSTLVSVNLIEDDLDK